MVASPALGPGGAKSCSQGRQPLVAKAPRSAEAPEGRHRSEMRHVAPPGLRKFLTRLVPGAGAPGYTTLPLRGNLLIGVLVALTLPTLGALSAAAGDLDWPAVDSETKAWSRWWWHGSAVTERDLTVEMEKYAAAGLGGLEITPIYGVRGGENEFVDYLAPRWMDLLEHVLLEAQRLGMGIDIATGNGWPFGGPWVDAEAACKNLVLETFELSGGKSLDQPVRHVQRPMVRAIGRRVNIADLKESIGENDDLQGLALEQVRFEKPLPLVALVAYGEGGALVDLTDRVDANGRLDWVAPPGQWTLYAVFEGWHGKMVERAGPGGEGNVIDHFSRDALNAYLDKFDEAFAGRDIGSLRAFFNDSYEVDDAAGNADFTPRLFDAFQRRRGYDLRAHLPALFGRATDDENARVLCDYRETLSDLLLEEFTIPWREWAHRHDATIRNQAHGSPANILDLYAASDVPETEGTDRIQFMAAASAAHVTGKRLVSAEAATWLDEHFLGTLAETKRWVDEYFLGGVNHICYHGTCYSPESDEWPGRLFYASVELQPTNPQWRHFHALNEYVARCQSFLQAGKPDNDVLVYYPIHDEWAKRGRTTLAHFNGEMRGTSARRVAEELLAAGYGVDFISDRQLWGVTGLEDGLEIGGVKYRALVVPECETMPPETLRRIALAATSGTPVVIEGQWPERTPGYRDQEHRAEEVAQKLNELRELGQRRNLVQIVQEAVAGRAAAGLAQLGILGEDLAAGGRGLSFIRRRYDDGYGYFIVNTGRDAYDNWTRIRVKAESVAAFDPITSDSGMLLSRPANMDEPAGDGTYVRIRVEPGQALIVRTFDHAVTGSQWKYLTPNGEPKSIGGDWRLTFVDGGPTLPEPIETSELKSWTELGGDAVKNFSGVGRHTIEFDAPEPSADGWLLDLGEVRESADVRLNGETLATLFCKPYRVRIPADKLQERNTLEIDVANLMANRIADLDRRGVTWQKFYNVNMAARRRENAGPRGVFTAAKWEPLPSGLLGPVTLTPVAATDAVGPGDAPSRWQFDYDPDDQPASVSLAVPEGNYRITATLGDAEAHSTTTIHAEVRRLLAETIRVPAGETATFAATVSVRTPRIADGREVRLKDRERTDEWANWDDKLTLVFSSDQSGVRRVVVERDERCPTLFLIGDSTVSDQANPPWNSWGQMLPRFFGPSIAVANHAESGESIRSALGERRFEKLYSRLRPGDWVAVQFGHNDMKSTAPDALATYTADLQNIVAAVRERGATPILITSMERKNGIDRDTLAGYPDAVRRVAKEAAAPLVDLHAMSKTLYRGLGDNLDAAFQDGTHHNDFGSYELARCVVEGLRPAVPELAAHLRADAGQFDPAHPDSPDNWGAATQP